MRESDSCDHILKLIFKEVLVLNSSAPQVMSLKVFPTAVELTELSLLWKCQIRIHWDEIVNGIISRNLMCFQVAARRAKFG